jgi:iron complex transport system permease protein
MSTLATTAPVARRRTLTRAAGLPIAALALFAVILLSIAIGAQSIPVGDVIDGLLRDDGSESAAIVRELRVPRTLVGLAVGISLAVAGALMQALTRNPLADPGLLGVEAGASAAVVIAIGWLGLNQPRAYVWFAFAGARLASVVVAIV